MTTKTPAQIAYEDDVSRRPTYTDGTPRRSWAALCPASQWSWGRPPIDHPVTLAAFTKPTTTTQGD